MNATFIKHDDPGHGWLEVQESDLKELGATVNDFSGYSYRKGNRLFLEEDCDASKFFTLYKNKHGAYPKYGSVSTGKFANMRILPGIKSVSHLCMIGVLLLGGISASWAQKTDSSSPEQVVRRLHESLTEAMREGGRLGFKGRLELLTPSVTRTHELDFIARTTLGNLWSKLSPDQQITFTDTFRQLSISSYADWFKSHEGEAFEIVDQQAMPREQVLVRTRIVKGKDELARLDYVLRETKDGWRIINIMANGVSDLALKRVEYRSILERDGFPALIDMLKKKIAAAEKS